MSDGVLVTVIWKVQPHSVEAFIELLRQMFPVTKTKLGFRSIRLLPNTDDPTEFLLVQEWDTVEAHQAYTQFRIESGDAALLIGMTTAPPELRYWRLAALASAQTGGEYRPN